MTDNEIIKALKCCKAKKVLCSHCPLKDVGCTCEDELTRYAYNLIKKQAAEIDTLKAERNNYKEWYFSLVNEVDKLPCKTVVGNNSEIHSKSAKDYDNLIANIKSEAIQDFAERLKESFLDLDVQINTGKRKTIPVDEYIKQSEWLLHEVAIQEIDNLVKEMMEENENAWKNA